MTDTPPTLDVFTPTLGRADRLAAYVDNVHATTRTDHVVTFVAEADDTATVVEVRRLAEADPAVRLLVNQRTPNYAGAYNTAALASTSPLWFSGADDLLYHDGWDLPAIAAMRGGSVCVVGTNDLAEHPEVFAGTAATHYLVFGDYVRAKGGTIDLGPGLAHFEGYGHWGPDSEIVGVARYRGVFAPCLESVVEHLHPITGKAPMDATYEAKMALQHVTDRVFAIRRTMWERPR